MTTYPVVIVPGAGRGFPIQTALTGSGGAGVMNSTDILSATMTPWRGTSSVFTPTIAFYTPNSSQTGYTQGQVWASWTVAQSLLCQPSLRYVLRVQRALVATPTAYEDIAILVIPCVSGSEF